MITIFDSRAEDFSTLGICVVQPTECVIEGSENGMMELTMTCPMDAEGRWQNLKCYNIVRAPSPVRETPLIRVTDNPGASGKTVTRTICKVKTYTGKRLRLRAKPSTSAKTLGYYAPGTEVVRLSVSGDWAQVVVVKGGASGWMSNERLQVVRTETESVPGSGTDSASKAIEPRQTREQLFRICEVKTDDEASMVYVVAKHIFYDLAANTVKGDYSPDGAAVGEVCAQLLARALNPHDFTLYCTAEGTVTGDYGRKGIANCLLEDEIGVASQTGAKIVLDNFDIFVLKDETRDNGVEIRHAKNLRGAELTENVEEVITRVVPVGKDENGDPLPLPNGEYVETPRAASIPVIRSKEIEYDVRVGDGEGEYKTKERAYAKLRELAAAEFADNGVDGATVGLDVDFVALENTTRYQDYAPLQYIHMGDTVRVVSPRSEIDAKLRMTGFTYDAAFPGGGRYKTVKLGQINELRTQVYGFDIARGTMPGTKILPGSVDAQAALRNATIGYAKIAQAAVNQLSADAIVAIRADISKLVAGNITTDQLYADLAQIATAQITTANIEKANIDWAQIATLSAQIATIAQAQITTANIKNANIDWAQIAVIAAGSITADKLAAGSVTTDKLAAGAVTAEKIASKTITSDLIAAKTITADSGIIDDAAIGTTQIADGSITAAKIVSLNADVINAGTLSAERLVLVGDDGVIYRINAASSGLSLTELAKDEYKNYINGTVIVAKSITAAQIAAQTITGNEILAGSITAKEINVSDLFASSATINALNAMDIRGNTYLKLYVTDELDALDDRVTTAESQILQKADSITLSTLQTKVDNISIGGTNLLLGTGQSTTTPAGDSSSNQAMHCYHTTANDRPQAHEDIVLSCDVEASSGATGTFLLQYDDDDGHYRSASSTLNIADYTTKKRIVCTITNPDIVFVKMTARRDNATGTLTISNAKLERGNKATDWSPSPEDPAGSLSVSSDYSKVDINTQRVRIVSKQMEVAVPADDGEDDVMRVDADGVHAEVVEADQVVSDSVVSTRGAIVYTPANGGALAAFLDELSGKHLTGRVYIDCKNVTSGNYTVEKLSGEGQVTLANGTMNQLKIDSCGSTTVYVLKVNFSNSGTALLMENSLAIFISGCTINASIGIVMGDSWPTRAVMYNCSGDCSALARVNWTSELRIVGSGKPTGTLHLANGGEVYNGTPDPTFAAKASPSIPTTQTVTVSLSPTNTYTLRGTSNSDGNKLYQGRYSSSQGMRKGVMLFTLPSDLTSASNIDSAVLTLRRISGAGQGGGVTVQVRCFDQTGTAYGSATAYGGQTVSIDVTSGVKAMKTNGYTGLMLYNPDTTTVSGKSYTKSYARFAGKGESGAPVLKISYRK